MTTYSREAMLQQVKDVADAAIECELLEFGWRGSVESGFSGGDSWSTSLPAVAGATGVLTLKQDKYKVVQATPQAIAPPNARHVGDDGAYVVWEVDPWRDIYDPWHQRIEATFKGWHDLPDPADLAPLVEHARQAVDALTPYPNQGGVPSDYQSDYADGSLLNKIDTLSETLGPAGEDDDDTTEESRAKGALVSTFRTYYGAEIVEATLHNQAQVAIGLGICLDGERKLWERGRRDIMTLATDAEARFKSPESDGGSIDPEVVGAFVDLLANFLPPHIEAAYEAGKDAWSLIQAVLPKETPKRKLTISGSNADAIYRSLDDAVSDLNILITDREVELSGTTMLGLLEDMEARDDFHINPAKGLPEDFREAPEIGFSVYRLAYLGYRVVPEIAAVMAGAAKQLQAADVRGAWDRPTGIGFLEDGAYTRWNQCQGAMDDVLTGSASELVRAGEILAEGAGYVDDVDGYQADALKGLEDEVRRGKHEWDNDHVDDLPPEWV